LVFRFRILRAEIFPGHVRGDQLLAAAFPPVGRVESGAAVLVGLEQLDETARIFGGLVLRRERVPGEVGREKLPPGPFAPDPGPAALAAVLVGPEGGQAQPAGGAVAGQRLVLGGEILKGKVHREILFARPRLPDAGKVSRH
jgi:hypothetical protein